MMLPGGFSLGQYQLTLQARQPLDLPEFKGSALRGGFGHTLKALACQNPGGCLERCSLQNDCAYGYIFETSPPPQSSVLRNMREIPRPFVIRPPLDPRSEIPTGDYLDFDLILIGQARRYQQLFVDTFQKLGHTRGLGQSRGKYTLLRMKLKAEIQARALAAYAGLLPADRLTLNFLTPTRLKQGGDWVRTGPPFQVLVRTLLRRGSALSYFHCGEPFEADFRGLVDRAAEVQVVRNDSLWQDWSRFSGRQKQRIEMGGLVGQVTYAGDLGDYLPLLALGELVHVGKGTVFGNGQYQLITPS